MAPPLEYPRIDPTMQETQPYRRPRQAQAQRVRRPTTKVPRRANWRRRILVTAFILLAATAFGTLLLWQRAVAFNDAVSTESALGTRLFGPFSPERVNVLLLGYNDESHGGAFLSDSINLLSIDKATETTTMIPIPRDLWVEGVAEVPQNMKVNEAFRIGYYAGGVDNGGDLAAEAVAQVTGLPIHGWISLDFHGLEAMVDAIGGITVENPTAFAYAWAEDDYLERNFAQAFEAGQIELDGARALDYARNRYTSVAQESSDFARSVRQQRVLGAIRAEITGWQTVSNGLSLADSLAGHLHTNLPVLDLAMLAGSLTPDRRIELHEGEILAATTNTIGQYVLAVMGQTASDDYRPLHEFLADRLAEPIDQVPPASDS